MRKYLFDKAILFIGRLMSLIVKSIRVGHEILEVMSVLPFCCHSVVRDKCEISYLFSASGDIVNQLNCLEH